MPLQAWENAATASVVGPVNVVLSTFDQSTWNFHRWRAFDARSAK